MPRGLGQTCLRFGDRRPPESEAALPRLSVCRTHRITEYAERPIDDGRRRSHRAEITRFAAAVNGSRGRLWGDKLPGMARQLVRGGPRTLRSPRHNHRRSTDWKDEAGLRVFVQHPRHVCLMAALAPLCYFLRHRSPTKLSEWGGHNKERLQRSPLAAVEVDWGYPRG